MGVLWISERRGDGAENVRLGLKGQITTAQVTNIECPLAGPSWRLRPPRSFVIATMHAIRMENPRTIDTYVLKPRHSRRARVALKQSFITKPPSAVLCNHPKKDLRVRSFFPTDCGHRVFIFGRESRGDAKTSERSCSRVLPCSAHAWLWESIKTHT